MCGIFGVLDQSDRPVDDTVVAAMGRAIRHRGPDDDGVFADQGLIIGMRRLAIIDVDGGRQPIYSENRDVVAVCNGEIYNFQVLRRALEVRGHKFRSDSDSEVLVHLYEEYGLDFACHLSGMFAVAIWDSSRRRLVLARDRLGVKPLYVAVSETRVSFASELKSLLECPWVRRQINPTAVREFLALGYVPAPLTMIQGVEKLAPGAMLVAENGQVTEDRYWQVEHHTEKGLAEPEWSERIRHTLEQSVVSQMISDVPLGAFLSGGIDSSAVVAYMARNSSKPVKTYSIGFDMSTGGGHYNELDYARQVADHFSTDHHEIVVRPDVASLIPELTWFLDEPVADSAFITTYLVSKFARQDVTVILSGVGGDELFGGYRRYWGEYLARWYQSIPRPIRAGIIGPIARSLPSDRNTQILDYLRLAKGFLKSAEMPADERYEQFVRVFDDTWLGRVTDSEITPGIGTLAKAFESSTSDDSLHRLIEVDLKTQLPDDLLMLTDRMSMAASLECRVPLLDDRLVELALSMPSEMKVRKSSLKFGLKNALRGVLPDDIIDRKKRGFGAPMGGWIKHELASFLDAVVNEESVRARGVLDWNVVEEMIQLHKASREDFTDQLLAVMSLELWFRIFIDGESHNELSGKLSEQEAA